MAPLRLPLHSPSINQNHIKSISSYSVLFLLSSRFSFTFRLYDENCFHPETPDEKLSVSDSERRNFSYWQGILKINAAKAEKNPFRMETRLLRKKLVQRIKIKRILGKSAHQSKFFGIFGGQFGNIFGNYPVQFRC